MGPDSVKNLSTRQALESLSTQINGQCPEAAFTVAALWIIRETVGENSFTMRMEDNVLWIREADAKAAADATVELSRETLDKALLRVDARTSWLDALLEDPHIRLNDPTEFLRRIARLTHVAPPTYEPEGE
jgi:alkyl sulfatase BDS1-like metallo-beta-lactamase superfamily hydrolase